MGFRLGIGGGIGPIRGGISTRGIGGGIGPLRAGFGFGRGGGGSLLALVIPFLLITLAIFWPYLLGTWIAVELGAAQGSTAANVVGWVLEAMYLTVIALAVIGSYLQRRDAKRAEAAAELAERERFRRVCMIEARGQALRVADLLERCPTGMTDAAVSSRERLLVAFRGIDLVEPRSAYRGGPRPQTPVDHGELLVSDRGLQFRSASKSVQWRYDRMVSADRVDRSLVFTVSNRQLVSGIQAEPFVDEVVIAAVQWGIDLSNGKDPQYRVAALRELAAELDESIGVMPLSA